MYITVARSPADLFEPVGVAAVFSNPIPAQVFAAILGLTLLANIAFLLGWRHRYTGPLFAALLLFVLCYRNSWSMIYHNDNLLVIHALILGVTRAADAFSLGAHRRNRASTQSATSLGWQYGWPLRLICTVTVLSYFLAGVAKLMGPLGLAWGRGDALRSQLAADGLRKEFLGDGAASLSFLVFDHLWLFGLIGVVTMLVEFGAPLALLHKWAGRAWALLSLGMHWGILVLMGIVFEYSLSGIIFAAFFPLERVADWFQKLRRSHPVLPVARTPMTS